MSTEKKIIQIDEYHCNELDRFSNEEGSIRALMSIVMENAQRSLRKLGLDRQELWKEIYDAHGLDMDAVEIHVQTRKRIGEVVPVAEKAESADDASTGR